MHVQAQILALPIAYLRNNFVSQLCNSVVGRKVQGFAPRAAKASALPDIEGRPYPIVNHWCFCDSACTRSAK